MARRIILDTNLCVLLCVGLTDRTFIARHKRLQIYDEVDFALLRSYLDKCTAIVFLPNITTETSNLLRQVAEPIRTRCALTLASILGASDERYVASLDATTREEYSRLGIADCALLNTIGEDDQLLTDDFSLYYAAAEAGLNVMNFNHLRESRPDIQL